MIKTDKTGVSVLQYEVCGVIRRLPLPKRGVSKKGFDWVMGSALMECYDEDEKGSARLFLITFDSFLVERLETIGVGKKVKVKYHIDVREKFDSCSVSAVLDEVDLMTDGESFLLGKEINVG